MRHHSVSDLVLILGALAALPMVARGAAPAAIAPVEIAGNTRVLWIESPTVHAGWQGDDLRRVVDRQTGQPCLEWFQNPATKGTATLTLTGIDPSKYDTLRLQWKYYGGGVDFQVGVGGRNWYLHKEPYRPGQWQDAWLDLALDDDRGGPLLGEKGELVIKLTFVNSPMNRADEERCRGVRIANLRMVGHPVRLACDPKQVSCTDDGKTLTTVYPLRLTNTTDRAQSVQLFLDPQGTRHFAPVFETPGTTLGPKQASQVRLTFSMPKDQSAPLPPLFFEEVPVYAAVPGDPDSLTTWFRGYVQWNVGGIVPPRDLKRPFMTPKTEKEGMTPQDRAAWLKKADAALQAPLVVPSIRHGYPTAYRCPKHRTDLKLDLVGFKRHYCAKGDHFLEGYEHLDREAGIRVHSTNSGACRSLGWAYWLTGDEKYARKAAELLLAYAQKFPAWEYARTGITGYASRVGHAILGECWFVHGFVAGYDLIAASGSLTDEQRGKIERDFFLLEADDVQTHRVEKNQQCEINAASGGAAINAKNWYLAARAFTGNYGLFDQVSLVFSEDGFSRENELPYHFAALLPLVDQGVMYQALGGQFFGPRLKRAFDAPIAVNPLGSPPQSHLYRIAYKYYRDPAYLPKDKDAPLANSVLELAGRTTLRRGTTADPRYMQIMWGSPTWRGGKDMLNYLTPLNTSVTRINYGIALPSPALSYQTLGGNVPEVDGLTQTGVRPAQTVLLGGDFPAAKYVAPRAMAVYPGVDLSRAVAIIDDAYVIVDRLASETPRRYSFPFYPGGDVTAVPGLSFAPYDAFHAEGPTYRAIRSPARAEKVSAFTIDYTVRKSPARMHCLMDGEGEVIRGTTWSVWNPVEVPFFLSRRRSEAVAWVQVLQSGAKELPITNLRVLPVTVDGKQVPRHQGAAVSLTTGRGAFLLIDCDLPGVKRAGGVETRDSLWVGKANPR